MSLALTFTRSVVGFFLSLDHRVCQKVSLDDIVIYNGNNKQYNVWCVWLG